MDSNLPENFTTICKIAGLPPERIRTAWGDVQEKILRDFFRWLAVEGNLSPGQQEKVLQLVENPDQIQQFGGIWETVAGVLEEKQLLLASGKMADIVLENLEKFYHSLRNIMTIEQRQVADAYIKTQHGGSKN